MPRYCDTYDSLFKIMEEDIGEALMNVSNELITIWKDLVETNWYSKYDPLVYSRTWQTLDAISLMDVKKVNGGYEIAISYDESKIQTIQETSPYEYVKHSDPSQQGWLVEQGFIMNNGVRREGAHALEEMINYTKSKDFKVLFENECRKLGYGITFK